MPLLYNLSFVFFVFLTSVAVLSSGASLVFQALFSTSKATANWNVISIVASYVALAVVTVGIYLSREITTVRNLRGIPKTYVAVKDGDVPKPVAELVATEYDRACAISHIARPHVASQEGWGSPGTVLEGVQFRRAMLNSLVAVDKGVRSLLPSFPLLKPHQSVASHFKPLETLIAAQDPTWLRRYDVLIQQARYAEREPSQQDYEECARLASYLNQMFRLLSDPRVIGQPQDNSEPASDDASYATAPSVAG